MLGEREERTGQLAEVEEAERLDWGELAMEHKRICEVFFYFQIGIQESRRGNKEKR